MKTRFNELNQKGVSLVELLVVIAAIGILVSLLANVPPSLGLIGKSRYQSLANQIANKQIEDIRATPYANLANGTTNVNDSRMNLLPSSTGNILIEDCDVSICSNSEIMKKITTTIQWQVGGKQQEVKLKTLVTEGGLK